MEHHVYFWLNSDHQSEESRKAFEDGFRALLEISEIAGGTWGTPAKTAVRPVTENSWDYGLSLKFASQAEHDICLLYTSPSPRDQRGPRMPSSA